MRHNRSEDVEDVWTIVRERDGLRAQVKRLEIENRRLRAIVSGYTDKAPMKQEDGPQRDKTRALARNKQGYD